jgi:K+-transporting ATPase ATPase C chain
MLRHISKSLWLLGFTVVLCCMIYPAVIWAIGQTVFPFQANGSILQGPDHKPIGSLLIAQPFTKDEYFQPRPSACSYDATASASSAYAASNYLLRSRVAGTLGPLLSYKSGPNAGKPVAPDIEKWFKEDKFQGKPYIVAQWAELHNGAATAWVNQDAAHGQYVNDWAKAHPQPMDKFLRDNPTNPQPQASDLAIVFFEHFSWDNPGTFFTANTTVGSDGKTPTTKIETCTDGSDVQSTFFEMWLVDHPGVEAQFEDVPGDLVTASGSGLDPHITFQNALFQVERVATKWAGNLKREPATVRKEIEQLLNDHTSAPFGGLVGEKLINVLEVNLEIRKKYGAPPPPAP